MPPLSKYILAHSPPWGTKTALSETTPSICRFSDPPPSCVLVVVGVRCHAEPTAVGKRGSAMPPAQCACPVQPSGPQDSLGPEAKAVGISATGRRLTVA